LRYTTFSYSQQIRCFWNKYNLLGRADPNQAVTSGICDPHSTRRSFARDPRPMRVQTYVPETVHFILQVLHPRCVLCKWGWVGPSKHNYRRIVFIYWLNDDYMFRPYLDSCVLTDPSTLIWTILLPTEVGHNNSMNSFIWNEPQFHSM